MSAPASERRVLFVCTHNAGRSIVAAALLNAHQPPGVRADSAGTDPADALNPTVVNALTERGISVTGITPKPITSELVAAADLVVTMGRHATGSQWGALVPRTAWAVILTVIPPAVTRPNSCLLAGLGT